MNGQKIANETLRQLGGNGFLFMTGSKAMWDADGTLTLKLRRNGSKCNTLLVKYDKGADLYNMEWYATRKYQCVLAYEHKGAACSDLRELFEEHTGLATSL